MDLRKFITLLKSDLPGLIFGEICAFIGTSSFLDINIAASIFNQARKTIDRHKWSDDSDVDRLGHINQSLMKLV